jgi:predicted esterase
MDSRICLYVSVPRATTLVVLIHGQEGSKQEWAPEYQGYGSPLSRHLQNHGVSWLAHDLYGHGDWPAQDELFDPGDICDENWPDFVVESVTALRNAIHSAVRANPVNRLVLVGYSTGNIILVKLLAEALPVPVDSIVMASLLPEQEMDDEFALHNNVSVLENRRIMLHSGLFDPDTSPAEIDWFFSRVPSQNKILHTYHSDHNLPENWIEETLDFIMHPS